jgi:hypothetical protein
LFFLLADLQRFNQNRADKRSYPARAVLSALSLEKGADRKRASCEPRGPALPLVTHTSIVPINPLPFIEEAAMANGSQLNELLKMRIDWVKDEVPPWLFTLVDKSVLRDLAIVSLERSRAVAELDLRAMDSAISIIKAAKF